MLEAMFEMEGRVAAAQVEAAQQVEVAADVLEIQARKHSVPSSKALLYCTTSFLSYLSILNS